MDEWEGIIKSALELFVADIRKGWKGRREREAVSHFAFRGLLSQVRPGTALYDPAQITIEVAVPQLPASELVYVDRKSANGAKRQITKDLVVWANPREYCWNTDDEPAHAPLLIMEWKLGKKRARRAEVDRDTRWLEKYTERYRHCYGYAVAVDLSPFRIACHRIVAGQLQRNWLVFQ